MKKILCFALVTLLALSLCGCGNSTSDVYDEKPGTTSAPEDKDVQTNTEQQANEALSDDELLSALEGEYVDTAFIEEFKNTKSMAMALEQRRLVAIREESGTYNAVIGDGHQGEILGGCKSVKYNGETYELYFEADKAKSLTILYDPEKDGISCEINCNIEKWTTNGKLHSFEKQNADEPQKLSRTLFEGMDGVSINNDGVYTEINGETYKMDVITAPAPDGVDMNTYSGGLKLTCRDGDPVIMQYLYDNGKISLYDFDDNLVKTIG